MNKVVKLSNGVNMPQVGLGTLNRTIGGDAEMEAMLDSALSSGYRHFDTAYNYGNEALMGKVIKRWLEQGKVKREELFITTKLPMIGMTPDKVPHFINKSLETLGLEYIDLYLVHNPTGFQYQDDKTIAPFKDGKIMLDLNTDLLAVWKAMEEQVDLGKAKSIGVSNFNGEQVERIVKAARIKPVNNQVELHANLQQKALRAVCAKHGVSVTGYAVIGAPDRKAFYESRGLKWEGISLLDNPVVKKIADSKGKSPGQILLRFLVQQGLIVIPKSGNPERIKQNISIFDFALLSNEMKELEGLDMGEQGRSFIFTDVLNGIEEHPEYPFKICQQIK